jgi:hypothetical protein
MKRNALFLLALCLAAAARANAEERVSVCFNYGCYSQAEVVYGDEQLAEIAALIAAARDAAEERTALGEAVGRLLGWAGKQSPIGADRGGNLADAGVPGMMDCIDHSTTTTRLLRVIERHGWLRHHRVLEPALRTTLLVFLHYSAQIEETDVRAVDAQGKPPARYVVDSWFFDNGHAAAVMPLDVWLSGASPNADD